MYQGSSRSWDQWIDALEIPARIAPTSWTGFGGNVGAGLIYRLTPDLGVFGEGRAFFGPQKELVWQLRQGTYNSIYDCIGSRSFGQSDADTVLANSSGIKFQVSPAFFQLVGGIKFFLR